MPEPWAICSRASRTLPSLASTQTFCHDTSPASVPRTSTSYASRVPVSRCQITSSGAEASLTSSTWPLATAAARAAGTWAVVEAMSTGASWATDDPTTRPSASARTTKSPPTTRRPSWVRS